ncbi:MAG: hypothetical protein Q4C13_03125 [Clostridia bacterium]|nr:hypothetical protein [Clostridia bacterium]
MNFVDIAILLVLAITVLGGLYRGFVDTACNIAATILAWGVAMLTIPLLAAGIKNNEKLFNTMLYYTEGAEYVAITDVELTRAPIAEVSADMLELVLDNADMPRPMDAAVTKNIATEALQAEGITTLGDYFNQTIVCVVINILSLVVMFAVLRIVFGFVIRGVDYGRGGFPVLQKFDGVIGAGLGLIHGVLLLFVLFLLVPIMLTVLPKLYEFLSESLFGEFFYQANFLIPLIPSI